MRLGRRYLNRTPGQALVELGLVLPVLLIMLLGMIDLGRGLIFGVSVQQGTREAVRVGAAAGLDPTVNDSIVLQRLIAASAPALSGCTPVLGAQQCGGGTWTFSLIVTAPGGAPTYASLAAARSGAAQGLGGYNVEAKAVGSVSLLTGFQIGFENIGLGQITVQGDAAMVVL
jgi:Flp pilus assembly protein TadG